MLQRIGTQKNSCGQQVSWAPSDQFQSLFIRFKRSPSPDQLNHQVRVVRMEGGETEHQQAKDELLARDDEEVGDEEEEDEEEEFLREGPAQRLGPAPGHLRNKSPPGYRVTEKEEKHQQKVGNSHRCTYQS